MDLTRRILLGAAGASLGGVLLPERLWAQSRQRVPAALRAPTFTSHKNVVFAGFRPVRPSGFRLDIERLPGMANRYWVNNYGHGGGGITLSWGCATQIVEWVRQLPIPAGQRRRVVVLGAGVIGLSTAKLLLDQLGSHCEVTIFADQITGRNVPSDGVGGRLGTTSDNAGGQFEPSFNAFRKSPQIDEARSRLALPAAVYFADDELIRLSYNKFMDDRLTYPVSSLPNYMTISSALPPSDNNLVRTRDALAATSAKVSSVNDYRADQAGPLPTTFISAAGSPGTRGIPCNYMIPTLLIEVPRMMTWLRRTMKDRLSLADFRSRDEVLQRFYYADVIVNCLGCDGALIAGGVNDIRPTLGVVLGLPPLYARHAAHRPATHYLYGGLGYIFSRGDYTIVGGWKKDMDWTDYRPYDISGQAEKVGASLVSYMGNFVKGVRQAGRWVNCFAGDEMSVETFDTSINPDDFLEMDGLHVCNDDPMRHRRPKTI